VVAETAQRVAVLYAGRVVETGPVGAIFGAPRHPYTHGLLKAMPGVGSRHRERLHVIEGIVPDLIERPAGCSFRDRCPRAQADCAAHDPELETVGAGHQVACLHPVSETGA
jgi:oligopeptide/dipeptide ABC transporter ATP-binding protein